MWLTTAWMAGLMATPGAAPVTVHDAGGCLGAWRPEVPADHRVAIDLTPLVHGQLRLIVVMTAPDDDQLLVRDHVLKATDCPQAPRLIDHWIGAALGAAAAPEATPKDETAVASQARTVLRLPVSRREVPIGVTFGGGATIDLAGDLTPIASVGIILGERVGVSLSTRVAIASEAVAVSLGLGVEAPVVGALAFVASADGGIDGDRRGVLGLEAGLAWTPSLGATRTLALSLTGRVEPLADDASNRFAVALGAALRLGGRSR